MMLGAPGCSGLITGCYNSVPIAVLTHHSSWAPSLQLQVVQTAELMLVLC
jgi:hypothetical protein